MLLKIRIAKMVKNENIYNRIDKTKVKRVSSFARYVYLDLLIKTLVY